MLSIFSPDSKLMQAVSRIADLVILNVIFLVTCLPIFTVGTALTSMYTVAFRLGTVREAGVVRPYFRAFKENFKQSTVLWLIIVLFGAASCVNIILSYSYSTYLGYTYIVFAALFALLLMIAAYTFPLLSQFDNDSRTTLKNALLLSIAYLPRSIVLVVLNVLPFALFLMNMYMFFSCAMIWVMIYFSAAAYLNAALLKKVFKPYIGEEEMIEEEV